MKIPLLPSLSFPPHFKIVISSFILLIFSIPIPIEVNSSYICLSKSLLSTTMKIVGISNFGCLNSFQAENAIVKVFPDPCQCQIRPTLCFPFKTLFTILFVALNCIHLAIIFMNASSYLLIKMKFSIRSKRLLFDNIP